MVSVEERFPGGHFPKCIVLQAVYWYLRYSLSYRDIEELMEERGVEVDHATVQRWVVKYTPLLETEFRKKKKAVGSSWRMDETYIKVKGIWGSVCLGTTGINCLCRFPGRSFHHFYNRS